jgi:GT2 family glycosyltransferase
LTDYGEVTVAIPHWNRADLLKPLLKQIGEQTYPIHRTVVIDNGSTDGSVAMAASAGAHVIEMGSNVGFAAAVNRGIESTKTEWIAILNNDVSLSADWLERLMSAAAPAGAWFATGKLVKAGNPAVIDGTFDLVCSGGAAWRCGEGRPDGPLWSTRRTIQFAPLTAALFRRRVFETVGLLDERFGSYLEDVDLGLRCAKAGLAGVFVPEARASHQGSATRGAWHGATVRQISRNQMFLLFKHFDSAYRWPAVVSQLLWWLLAIRHGTGLAFAAGKWEALRMRSELFERDAAGWKRLEPVVRQTERDLRLFQEQSGFDWYWRWYFMLTGGGR